MIDIANKRFVILGLQGSGKTELAKYLLRQSANSFVYDALKEYEGFRRYVPTNRNSIPELEECVTKLVLKRLKPSLFILDEANRYLIPKPHALPRGIEELNDWSRHIGISWGCVARRPTQLHTDIMELSHYLFIFVLRGKNDCAYLDSILPSLGDMVSDLPVYSFAIVTENRSVTIHSPITL
jgi:hypothetical protein